MRAIRVGTSGWAYREWVGPFYPPGTPTSKLLGAYATQLSAVEAHATYRRLPTVAAVTAWAAAVPEGFRFAPKAHANITHQRDTAGVEQRVSRFLTALSPLGDRLGPVLFQLPHHEPDLERLGLLLAAVPDGVPTAFDLSPAWFVDEVFLLLEAFGATCVLTESDARAAPDVDIGPFSYVRLRKDRYTDDELQGWAERLTAMALTDRDVYVYVKHDQDAWGPRYARQLSSLVTPAVSPLSRPTAKGSAT